MIILPESLLYKYNISYILLDAWQQVLEYKGAIFLGVSKINRKVALFDLIPELTGSEDILQAILNQEMPSFELEDVNRYNDDEQQTTYLTIHIESFFQQDKQYLLITMQDTTHYANTQQTLRQQRNELALLQQRMDETNQRLEYIMQHYVPREVGKVLMGTRQMPSLGGDTQEISTLFVDLCNYTHISEKQKPEETIKMLYVFMDIVCSAIINAGGVVVNYMGDAVMAIFNAPSPQPDHALRAINAGVEMQRHAIHNKQNLWGFNFSVGINTGRALIGNLGTPQHFQYTAVGDTINIASRICDYARAREILVGAETYRQLTSVNENINARQLSPICFKGKSESIVVYSINY